MIYIDQNSSKSLFEQIYEQLKEQILSGELSYKQKLPSIRTLAAELAVGKNTVDNAYKQLEAEGYIISKAGSGFYIDNINESFTAYQNVLQTEPILIPASHISDKSEHVSYDFQYGEINPDTFPWKQWDRLIHWNLSSRSEKLTSYSNCQGSLKLRKEIQSYLLNSRGIHCLSEQIIITNGLQQSIDFLSKMESFKRCTVGFPDPGYDGAKHIFQQDEFQLIPLSQVSVEKFHKEVYGQKIDLLYLTPSHQFPKGNIMGITDRYQFLKMASEKDFYMIEDDYDSEFRYHMKPLPALASIDEGQRVIYIGTFSKALAPGLRLNYMVLPIALLPEYRRTFANRYPTMDYLSQETLADFMHEGLWEKHLRSQRRRYEKIHDCIVNELNSKFGDQIEIIGTNAGFHMLIYVKNGMNQEELISSALRKDVKVYSTAPYYCDKSLMPENELLLGFGNITVEQVKEGIGHLAEAWTN